MQSSSLAEQLYLEQSAARMIGGLGSGGGGRLRLSSPSSSSAAAQMELARARGEIKSILKLIASLEVTTRRSLTNDDHQKMETEMFDAAAVLCKKRRRMILGLESARTLHACLDELIELMEETTTPAADMGEMENLIFW